MLNNMTKWVTPRKQTTTTLTRTSSSLLSFLLNFSKSSLQLSLTTTYLLLLTTLIITALAETTSGFRSGEGRKLFGGYRITPKHCRATKTLPSSDPRSNGPTICMFNHECAQRNGEVVGACMDGFLFGACCQIPNTQELASTLINDAQNAYYQLQNQQKLQYDQQEHQQQQHQQVTNAAIAQSYENYGDESLQQHSDEQKHQTQQNNDKPNPNIYDPANLDKVYQQLESSSASYFPQYSHHQTSNVYESESTPLTNSYPTETESNTGVSTYEATGVVEKQQNLINDAHVVTTPSSSSVEEQDYVQSTQLFQSEQYQQQTESTEPQQQFDAISSGDSIDAQSHVNDNKLVQQAVENVADQEFANSNDVEEPKPPNFHVHKHSVQVSSPSSSPHNDDFVMQVLNTLPPEQLSDHIVFTTEVPMKITNSLTEQTSSESNSFEEEMTVTQEPTKDAEQTVVQNHIQQQDQQQSLEHHKQQVQQQHNEPQQENVYPHNHFVLDSNKFTHSDITHPGADADLVVNDLQFSTGYGPVPVFVIPPKEQGVSDIYGTTTLPPMPSSVEEQYVLVPTITKDNIPANSTAGTTSTSVTTHDSIESIILQLNNTNAGPAYSIVSQQNHSYDEVSAEDPNSNVNTYIHKQTDTTIRPHHEENEMKRPDENSVQDFMQQGYITTQTQLPAYLEPVTITKQQNNPQSGISFDIMSGEKQESPENHTARPIASFTQAPLTTPAVSAHTDPASNYNDATSNGQLTSTFNKMPAMGIAYPVDMSYTDEESNLMYDSDSFLQTNNKVNSTTTTTTTSTTTTSRPTTVSNQKVTEPQLIPAYTRLPSGNTQQSMATYIGVVTSQNYNQTPQSTTYNQLPPEIFVSSHTTKIEEELHSSATEKPQRLTTTTYVDSLADTTYRPVSSYDRPSYTSPVSPQVPSDPQYGSRQPTATPQRPMLVTASPKPKPNDTKKPAQKRPTTGTNNKTNIVKTPIPPIGQNYGDVQYETVNSNKGNTKHPQIILQSIQKNLSQPIFNYDQAETEQEYIFSTNKKTEQSQNKPEITKLTTNTYQQPELNYSTEQNVHKPTVEEPEHNYTNTPSKTRKPTQQPTNFYQQATYIKTKPPISEQSVQKPSEMDKHPALSYNINFSPPPQPSVNYNQQQHIVSSPTKHSATRRPSISKNPISTSYVTGPSSPRPPTTFNYHYDEVPPLVIADDKLDQFLQSTAQNIVTPPNYESPVYMSSVTPIHIHAPAQNYNKHKKPGFVKINPTTKSPVPTVLITPKPTVINLVTSSAWTQRPSTQSTTYNTAFPPTTPLPAYGSTSFIYNPAGTRRPELPLSTQQGAVSSNDFDDPGYFGAPSSGHPAFMQSTTDATFALPSDERPAFPGYYGPTPTYPAFSVPGEKLGSPVDEETYTSPNDFVNFPPVRNPNLNMSAIAASAVTSDIALSTPAFVEDVVLKDKMNTLVHKIVESLQGNFEALADMIDDTNNTAATFQADPTVSTRRPSTRKPTRIGSTQRPKTTTKKPNTRVTTKATTNRTPTTTRRPVQRRTTTTRRPITRKPTRKTSTTTPATVTDDELVDEEDEEDVNPSENEIDQSDTVSTASERKIQCGMRPHVKSGRIVGGKGATFGAYPWQVLVRESTWLGLFTKNKCGGVLITSRYVITAAHCQPGFLASLVAVMGEFDISGDLESKRAVTKNVKRVIVHRQYDPATFENDLALLELDSPVQFDSHIVPICMPPDRADFTGRMATVTGWGRLKYGGGVPSVLQEVQVPIIENSVCQEMFNTAGHNKKIINSFLCAGYANGQKDSCEGDSGGPLVLQRSDGRYELAGTVSHGIKCAAPYLPGVYMRTTFYKPWLKTITGVK